MIKYIPALLAVFCIGLAGCSLLRTLTDEDRQVESAQDLVTYLGYEGYVLRPVRIVPAFALSESGHEYRVDGNRLLVYEFESTEDAEESVTDYLLDTSGGGLSSVFQHQTLMVAYVGRSAALHQTLTQVLGPPVY
ncbi:MAG: hypothetical protein R3284_06000 [Rubricoccaceae bacterium]|nr:hypothetical protein [Rubricoccaceae bacterium]